MEHHHWQIQEAKQRFSEVIRLAKKKGSQQITCRGEPDPWILSDKNYKKLLRSKEDIVSFFQRSPHREIELPIERRKDLPRKWDL